MAEQRYRVVNKCRYNIGTFLPNGQEILFKAGSFQMLTADDINYIESLSSETKLFGKRMLVPYDSTGAEVPLTQVGMFIEEDPNPHMDNEQIAAMLKQSVKKIETWLEGIEDMAELMAIYEVATGMDLPASKLKILAAKMPDREFIS